MQDSLHIFPDPHLANEDGLLAMGGSLDTPVLLEAYSRGIFPWYSDPSLILWWSPDPRMVLYPEQFKVSKSLAQRIRNAAYTIRFDTCFDKVIKACSGMPRSAQEGTWITDEMIHAYIALHKEGYAHSAEVYNKKKLVGGLYGVSLGGCFFGESMFHCERDASKIALYYLVEKLKDWDFDLIDVQQSTGHLRSLGAVDIPRRKFLSQLNASLKKETRKGYWGDDQAK